MGIEFALFDAFLAGFAFYAALEAAEDSNGKAIVFNVVLFVALLATAVHSAGLGGI